MIYDSINKIFFKTSYSLSIDEEFMTIIKLSFLIYKYLSVKVKFLLLQEKEILNVL